MAEITNIEDINKIIRAAIIENSGVNKKFVRDLLSEYGVDLDKDYESSVFHSLKPSDVAVLFELSTRDTTANMSETEYGTSNLKYYQYFDMKIIMYGNNSSITALRTIARLRSAEVRDDLICKGIHIVSISDTSKTKELMNGVMWQRNDFTISLACEMTITPIKSKYEIEGYSKLDIYTK